MGEMIKLVCTTCDIDRDEYVGFGRMAEGQELCACYHCHRYVKKKTRWTVPPEAIELKCPYCRREISPIKKNDKCPVCNTRVQLDVVGEWD